MGCVLAIGLREAQHCRRAFVMFLSPSYCEEGEALSNAVSETKASQDQIQGCGWWIVAGWIVLLAL